MKKLNLGQALNTLANIGVIAGILFLALELQQNNELMAADARFNRMTATTESYTIEALQPDIAAILIKESAGEALTDLENFRIQAFWMRVLKVLEWGYVEQPENQAWANGQRRNAEAYASYRRVWQGNSGGPLASGKDVFDARFVEFMEEHVFAP